MSLIKHIALRDARIVSISMSAGKGAVETTVKIHAPVDKETAELIGVQEGMLDEILESAKSRFRMLSTDVNIEGAGNFASKKATIPACEANHFLLKTAGDLGDGNSKSKTLHVVFSLIFGKPNVSLFNLFADLGNAPLLMKLKGDAAAQQQELELDPEAAQRAAKSAAAAAAKPTVIQEESPQVKLLTRYRELSAIMKGAKVSFPAGTQPLGAASKTDLARIAKKAKDTPVADSVEKIIAEIIILRDQSRGK